MTAMTSIGTETLAGWLLEQIAEDETLARKATYGRWHADRSGGIDAGDYDTVIGPGRVECMAYCYGGSSTIEGDNLDADRDHIARWDPARVLAECEAKRRIVEATREAMIEWADDGQFLLADHTLRLLAVPYADRPGYQMEWVV